MKDCTSEIDNCEGERDEGRENDYKCFAKDDDSECTWTLLCSLIPKIKAFTVDCSNFPVSDSIHYKCVGNTESKSDACKEVKYSCNEVPQPDDGTQVTCSDFGVQFPAMNGCAAKTGDDDKACEEKTLCHLVAFSSNIAETECPKRPTTSKSKGCVKDLENSCKEVYLCSKVTRQDKENDKTITCSSLAVSDSSKFYCDDAPDSEENPCKEVKYCEEATNDDRDMECEERKTKDSNKGCLRTMIGGDRACRTEYFCEKASLDTEGVCTQYALEKDRAIYSCEEDMTSTSKCKEIVLCNQVTEALKGSGTLDCSKFAISFFHKGDYVCIENDGSETNFLCKEEKLCLEVKNIETGKTCSDYPVMMYNSNTHICMENEGTTNAEQPCQELELCTDGKEIADGANCQDYPVAKNLRDTQGCFLKDNSYCGPKDLCALVEMSNLPIDCSDYPVSWEKRKTHKCVNKISIGPDKKACQEEKEITFCLDTNADPQNCNDYPIKDDDGTKKCIKNEASAAATPCTTETLKCAEKTTGATNAICEKLTLEDQNKECKLNGDACEEKDKTCLTETDTTKCTEYILSDLTKKCVENTNKAEGQTICIEQTQNCAEITSGATEDICKKLTVIGENKECKLNGNACEEKDKTCLTETDTTKCTEYILSDLTKKCVENTNKAEGQTICIEQIKNCAEITSDATEDICKKLTLKDDVKTVCKKDSNENKCVVVTYCEYGEASNDDDCGKFAVKDTNKECKKKENEGVCEEVTKAQTNVESGNLIIAIMFLLLLLVILIIFFIKLML